MLLVASYIFYGAWDWRFLPLLFISTTVNYFCGIFLQKTINKKHKKRIVSISIATSLILLGIFKYYDFFVENFQVLLANVGISIQPYFLNIALPIGISFYTFQTMSYTIDVYRGKLKPTENYLDFALYVSFFPQLVAGPIERGTRLIPQILNPRVMTWEKFCRGTYFFYWGLFLKVFIADNLADIVDPVYSSSGPYNGLEVLISTYAFSFQIYCDFAGYSFMAIGLALAMGIELMENFRRPYFSKNISEFWRRWHISLSSWFKDYLYIPLGGNRISPARTFLNLLIVFLLCGLWHGADWNFGFFGVYHATMIGVYFLIRNYWDRMNGLVQIFLTYQLVCIGWLIFRTGSLGQAGEMLQSVVFNFNLSQAISLKEAIIKLLAFTGILIIIQIFQDWKKNTLVILKLPPLLRYAFYSFLGCLILIFGNFGEKPFIYFQF
jgi:alginate O-acetyltransferase complex protein AlgI